jgi:hypothetical protein
MVLANLGSESETCVGSRVHLVGVSIYFEKNFYRLPFTPPSLVRRIGPSPATGTCLASTQALRSRRVSFASKIPDCVVAHRSDQCSSPVRPVPTGQTGWTHQSARSGTAAAPSSVLRSWLSGSTKEPSDFLVNHWKSRELGVASANLHS